MKLRTLVGLGVGYAIGSQFGPARLQRMLSGLIGQDSSESTGSEAAADGQPDVSWPSTEFEP